MTTRIDLASVHFGEMEKPLAEAGGFKISTFRYASGIAALRVKKQAWRNHRAAVQGPPDLALRVR